MAERIKTRSGHAWQIAAVAISAGSLVVALIALDNSQRTRRDTARMFELERRPWLKTGLANCRVDTVNGFFWCDVTFKNVGQGTASYFVSQTDSGSTPRDPVADTAGIHFSTKPAYPLAPGEEQSAAKRVYFDCSRVRHDGRFYLHVRTLFEGTETEGTYYQEQVFFVKPYELQKTGTMGTSLGYERTYYGELIDGKVVLSSLPRGTRNKR